MTAAQPETGAPRSRLSDETDPPGIKGAGDSLPARTNHSNSAAVEILPEGAGGPLVRQVRDARGHVDLERIIALESKIARARRGKRAEATLRAYESDWSDFTVWCDDIGLACMPADPSVVAAYLTELAEPPDDRPPRKWSTIRRRVYSIAQAHRVAGYLNPCTDVIVRETLKGLRRQLGVAPDKKRGITIGDLRAVANRLDQPEPPLEERRPIDVRDRAILLLGFAIGQRRSNIAALDVADVSHTRPQGILVHIRSSKTDQEAKGHRVEVVYGTQRATCPITAVREWCQLAQITDGPLFRRVHRSGRIFPHRLSGQAIANIVKRHMGALGYDITDFAGHSLRRGMATTAIRGGAKREAVKNAGGWTTDTTLDGYIEEGEEFSDPASRYLGL